MQKTCFCVRSNGQLSLKLRMIERWNRQTIYVGISWVRTTCSCAFRSLNASILASGRVQLAQQLLNMLPAELASVGEPEDQATEYLHYRQFFSIWATLERIVECQALEVSTMNRDTRNTWLQDYKVSLLGSEC